MTAQNPTPAAADHTSSREPRVLVAVALVVTLLAALLPAGCSSGDSSDTSASSELEQASLSDLNLDLDTGAGGLSSDLDAAEEALIRESLAIEFETELGVSTSEAACLSEAVAVGDLLEAGSASNGGDGSAALERVLQSFDECEVPRSVFEQ